MSKKTLIIRDDIHGDIIVRENLKQILAHERFQRLRHIHQTGLLYLVYPGMRHSRYEHSLGTMFLAEQWFNFLVETLTEEAQGKKFFPISSGKVQVTGGFLDIDKTIRLVSKLKDQEKKEHWKDVVCAAALLHDVGHGPFSHSIESYGLLSLEGIENFGGNDSITKYLEERKIQIEGGKKPKHEDFSLAYINEILSINSAFTESDWKQVAVAALVHEGFREHIHANPPSTFDADTMLFIELFAQLISGRFDVDRQDYMERDSRKAGVSTGLVEAERLRRSVFPVFAQINNKDVVRFVAKARTIHVVDHFIISLFKLYTQLYKHPAYEGFQFELGKIFESALHAKVVTKLDSTRHAIASEYSLATELNSSFDSMFDKLVSRQFVAGREVFQSYSDHSDSSQYSKIVSKARAMFDQKDADLLWLIDKDSKGQQKVVSWAQESLVVKSLEKVKYDPTIYWRNKNFEDVLRETVKKVASKPGKKRA